MQVLSSESEYPQLLFKDFCDNDCQQNEDYSEAALRTKKDGAFSDQAYRLRYSHEQSDWKLWASHQSRGAGFRSDLGFGPLADHNQSVLGGGYNWYSENSWWNKIQVSGDWNISHNDDENLLEKEAEMYLGVSGRQQSYFEIGYLERQRVGLRHDPRQLSIKNNTTLFDESRMSFFAEMRPDAALYFRTFVAYGDQIDYDNNRIGQQLLRFIALYSDIQRNQDNYTFDVDKQSKSLICLERV